MTEPLQEILPQLKISGTCYLAFSTNISISKAIIPSREWSFSLQLMEEVFFFKLIIFIQFSGCTFQVKLISISLFSEAM